jgi:hypothetical protein
MLQGFEFAEGVFLFLFAAVVLWYVGKLLWLVANIVWLVLAGFVSDFWSDIRRTISRRRGTS